MLTRAAACRLAVRVHELMYPGAPPRWLLAAGWASKAGQGLANAAVWAAPFLKKPSPRRESRGSGGDARTVTTGTADESGNGLLVGGTGSV